MLRLRGAITLDPSVSRKWDGHASTEWAHSCAAHGRFGPSGPSTPMSINTLPKTHVDPNVLAPWKMVFRVIVDTRVYMRSHAPVRTGRPTQPPAAARTSWFVAAVQLARSSLPDLAVGSHGRLPSLPSLRLFVEWCTDIGWLLTNRVPRLVRSLCEETCFLPKVSTFGAGWTDIGTCVLVVRSQTHACQELHSTTLHFCSCWSRWVPGVTLDAWRQHTVGCFVGRRLFRWTTRSI